MSKLSVRNSKTDLSFSEKPILGNEIATRMAVGQYFSILNILPDPDEVLKRQGRDIMAYRDLLNDGRVSANWEQRVSETLAMGRNLDTTDLPENVAKVYNDFWESQDWDTIFYNILEARFYGFSVFEIEWIKQNGLIMPGQVQAKPQEWFFFNNDNELRFRRIGGELIEGSPYQWLLVQNRPTYRNPYGERLASKLFWYVVFKKGGNKFWVRFNEKYGMPYAIGKVPPNTSEAIKRDLLNGLNNLVQDGVAVIPNSGEIEILDKGTNSKSPDNYKDLKDYCNDEITEIILTQTLTSSSGKVGSLALGAVHDTKLSNLALSDKALIERTINQLFSWIAEINFGKDQCPALELQPIEGTDKLLAERDQILSGIGVKFTKEYFESRHNLNPEDFDLVSVTKDPTAAPPQADKSLDKTIYSEAGILKSQKQIDDFADLLLSENSDLGTQLKKAIDPVLEVIAGCSSYKEINSKLSTIYPKMDTSKLEKMLTKVVFIAENFGRVTVSGK